MTGSYTYTYIYIYIYIERDKTVYLDMIVELIGAYPR